MPRLHKSFFAAAGGATLLLGLLVACTTPVPSPMAPPPPINPMGTNAGSQSGGHTQPLSTRPRDPKAPLVYTGIDVLEGNRFVELKGKRVGLITNQTSINRNGKRTREVLAAAPEVNLVALYTPEHGLDGKEKAAAYISTRTDPLTGVIAHSLYGPTRKPTAAMLKDIDVMVFDLQDIGSRSYTYISTMLLAMEACGENNKRFMVLDRPNPLGGERVCGPPMEQKWISFVGQFSAPYCHGLTAGEIAHMANAKGWSKKRCDLQVIKMINWKRNMSWRDTRLLWVATSPNIPNADSPLYYATTGVFGSLTGGDIGIGTLNPFEMVGGKGIDPDELTRYLNGYGMKGVTFTPYRSVTRPGYAGAKIKLDHNAPVDIAGLNLIFIDLVSRRIQGDLFAKTTQSSMNIFHKVYGSDNLRGQLASGKTPANIITSWKGSHDRFRKDRKPYLLY